MKKLLFLILFSTQFAYGEPNISEEYNFAMGVNLDQLSTDIDPRQSPDMCNCISEPLGAASIRNGTERYNTQAFSSYPVTSSKWVYASTGTSIKSSFIMTNKDSVIYTTGGVAPVFSTIYDVKEYDWKWIGFQNRAIGIGGLENDIKSFDPLTNTLTNLFTQTISSNSLLIRAKNGIVVNDYLILANVVVATWATPTANQWSYYPSRIYYSRFMADKIATFTATRYIDFATEDGEEITGIGSIYGAVHFFKPSKIGELTWTLALDLPSAGGDWEFYQLVNNFGLKSDKGLANAGLNYIFPASDGIRTWNGSRQTRLQVADESRIVSDDGIKTLIQKLIRNGTYDKSSGFYYENKNWYVFSYEDPDKFPKGVNNSLMIYDFRIGQWFPFCGINAVSFSNDKDGNAFYGDSQDGYVYYFDKFRKPNDDRKEMIVDVMDSSVAWVSSTIDRVNVKEGTASVKIFTTGSVLESSMTIMKQFNFGEWQDNTKVTRDDKLSFKVRPHNLTNITNLRVDLEVNIVDTAFDTNFTSYTLANASFTAGDLNWTTVEIPLSEFPIRPDWTDFESELIPFAKTLFFYGVRFVLTGVDISSVSIDDIRIVQNTQENPIEFYRYTKLFDLQTKQEKNFGSMLLTMNKPRDVSLNVDIYNNFGARSRTERIEPDVNKEVVIINYDTGTIARLNSYDFELIESTSIGGTAWQWFQGVMSDKFIWIADRSNDRIMKYSVSPFGVFISSYGSFGDGLKEFNTIHQMCRDGSSIFLVDINNQRVKQHRESDLSFIRQFGGLGSSTNTTKLHQPTGITVDENNIGVIDEGNFRQMRLNKSTMGYLSQTSIEYNTFGETSIIRDEKYDYLCYRQGNLSEYDTIDIVLEKRDKNNGNLVNRVTLRPKGSTASKLYGNRGDIALLGDYIFVIFNDDDTNSTTATHYIQKYHKEDFTLVDEKILTNSNLHSVLGDSLSYFPSAYTKLVDLKTDGRYIQMKYYSSGQFDNNFTLYNQTFLVSPKSQGY